MSARHIQTPSVAELTAVLFETRLPNLRRHKKAEVHPRTIAQHAAELERIGRALLSLAVAQCNREWTDRDQRRRDRLKADAQAIAAQYAAKVSIGGDPRGGSALTLYLPTNRSNGFGADGWRV